MSKRSIGWGWLIGIAICGSSIWSTNCAFADIIPDGTLPNNSSVKLEGNNSIIEGGTQAGGNLFHSFRKFSVPTNGAALFNNAADIQNIISRVTGGSVSNIDGLIYANGTANLFLINPSGIIFGQGARLDIGGSFVGTTANAIAFGNQGFFSASNPESSSSLLTVNPSALLFNQIKTASIENNSVAPSGFNPSFEFIARGLRVLDGKSLLLVGGDINMDGGGLNAFGGRVELGGLAGAGTVGLNGDNNNLSLSFPARVERSDVSLSNGAEVNVRADDSGSIAINAQNLNMAAGERSLLLAGIDSGLGSVDSQAGDIEINVTEAINLSNESLIANTVRPRAVGKGGNINITTGSLSMTNGAQLQSRTRGQGDGGNINISARNTVSFDGVTSDGFTSGVTAWVEPQAVGNGGNINIIAGSFDVNNGAGLTTDSFGQGNAGSVNINARNTVFFQNGAKITTGTYGTGDAGDLTIQTRQLSIQNGSVVRGGTTSSGSSGSGGRLSVTASESIEIIDSILSNATNGTGSAKGITIQTGQLIVGDGALISTSTSGTGDAGDLTIQTRQLSVRDGSQISNGTFSGSSGLGGSLSVTASESIEIIDSILFNQTEGTGSAKGMTIQTGQLIVGDGALISTGTVGAGDAGDLTIQTRQLSVRDGAQISTGAFPGSSGLGGSLSVTASESIELIGSSPYTLAPSGLFTRTSGTKAAGDLTIQTRQLTIRDGAALSASTFGSGLGGNLSVTALESIELIGIGQLSGGGLYASTYGTGSAGNLTIQTQRLSIRDGAQVSAGTFPSSSGAGGSLSVAASESIELIGTSANGSSSGLYTQTEGTGSAGNLTVQTQQLSIRDGAVISAITSKSGLGGSLNVTASESIELIGGQLLGGGLFASTDANSTGDAGDLTVKTNNLLVRDGAEITVQSLGTGTAGNMTLNSRSIRLDNNALLSGNTQSAKVNPNREQATININSQDLIMSRNSNIRTNARGENVIGGNINIDTDFLIGSENSDISANSANFRGGNVRINAQGIFGIQFRDVASDKTSDITATGASSELSGNVEINTPDVDPNSGLVNLPTIPVDTQVAQTCQAGGNLAKSSFTITGRGGLPPNPGEALNADAVQVDLVALNPNADNPNRPFVPSKTTSPAPEPIIEATGLTLNQKGEVVLTANLPTTTPHSPWLKPASCKAIRNS
ncbi:filamentous hemagglutinin N-terminal domain-containing protein [Nostoc sp. CHAB 5834]|nr:filamentous hemagglutinin N-terminal domain-containing protein [Nostoc sp. CHAB 5834]